MSEGTLCPLICEAGSALRAEARGGEVTWEEAAARRADSCVKLAGVRCVKWRGRWRVGSFGG